MDEGQSAYHGKHLKGDFGRMLQSIQDGKYPSGQTVLLVESENRLNRQSARKTENLVELTTAEGELMPECHAEGYAAAKAAGHNVGRGQQQKH